MRQVSEGSLLDLLNSLAHLHANRLTRSLGFRGIKGVKDGCRDQDKFMPHSGGEGLKFKYNLDCTVLEETHQIFTQ